jgi:hypothetical protein
MKGSRRARGSRSSIPKTPSAPDLWTTFSPHLSNSTLEYQRQVLEQMQLCQQLMVDASGLKRHLSKGRDTAEPAVDEWYMTLAAATRVSARAAIQRFVDIPSEPDPGKRAVAFFPIISAVVNDLDTSPQDNTKRFLMHVAWHESARLTTRVQIGGPAKSFFQFEAYRAKEALEFAETKGLSSKLAVASGKTENELKVAKGLLPDYDPNDSSCSVFPTGNLVGTLLETNDQFGSYLARIEFMRFAAAIGTTNAQHADYWYQYWKRTGGNPTKLKATFIQEAIEVDALIVPMIRQFRFKINSVDNFLARNSATWLQKQKTTITNTYFDRGHDATWVLMDDGAKGVVEVRVPLAGGDGEERLYRRGNWHSYAKNMIAEYY